MPNVKDEPCEMASNENQRTFAKICVATIALALASCSVVCFSFLITSDFRLPICFFFRLTVLVFNISPPPPPSYRTSKMSHARWRVTKIKEPLQKICVATIALALASCSVVVFSFLITSDFRLPICFFFRLTVFCGASQFFQADGFSF
ncbi:hypothetical protein Ga0100230_014895 [Opitutaceae bacterium TAV3]|nr:hypothetical protein Ga0100230_014895 [Opitutaceae bacterium TAV3]